MMVTKGFTGVNNQVEHACLFILLASHFTRAFISVKLFPLLLCKCYFRYKLLGRSGEESNTQLKVTAKK